jgi:hypothetical protein
MSVRLEWTIAQLAGARVYQRGDELADGNRVTANYALAIGTTIIEGDGLELLGLLEQASDALEAAFVLSR